MMFKKLWTAITEFLSDVRGELKKISYPTKSETIGSTTVVLLFSLIMSLCVESLSESAREP